MTADHHAAAATGPQQPTFRLALPAARSCAAAARAFVAAALDAVGWEPAQIQDARSVVSELVVAALARGRRPRELTLAVEPGGSAARLEVLAYGRVRAPAPDGRAEGMALVAGLACEHGSRPVGDARVWWAVLARPASAGSCADPVACG